MKIELYIDGEKKIFTAPFVPMLAKRKYLEIMANAEQRGETTSFQQQLEEDDEMVSILSDIVFKGQFTVEDVYNGASNDYVYAKLREAIFGIQPSENKKEEEDEGNDEGK